MSINQCLSCGGPGQLLECLRCRDVAALARKAGIKSLGGVMAFEEYTADNFKPSENQYAAFMAAQTFEQTKDNLYFFGPVGSGKTHLATIAARRFLGKVGVTTVNPFEISRLVRSTRNGIDESRAIAAIADSRVLVIDDMGTAKDTEFLVGLLYEIINHRYMNHKGGLIITSNLKPSELSEKMGDDRISSRLIQICKIISISGEVDHRMQNQGGRNGHKISAQDKPDSTESARAAKESPSQSH